MSQLQEKPKKPVLKDIPLVSKGYSTPVGNKIQPIYKMVFDEKLRKDVVKVVGEQDIDDFIQKSSSSTDIAFLQREAIRTGQYPADPRAVYGVDMTLMPTNIHELYKSVNDIDSHFLKLPADVQAMFGSAENYKNAVLDGNAEAVIRAGYEQLANQAASQVVNVKEGE